MSLDRQFTTVEEAWAAYERSTQWLEEHGTPPPARIAKHMGRTVDAAENYRGRSRSKPALLSDDDVIEMLREACDRAGGRAKWAKTNGYSRQFVDYVLAGTRRMSVNMAGKFGLNRVSAWKKRNSVVVDGGENAA